MVIILGSILVNSSDFFNADVAMISKIIARNKNRKFFIVHFFTKVNFKAENYLRLSVLEETLISLYPFSVLKNSK